MTISVPPAAVGREHEPGSKRAAWIGEDDYDSGYRYTGRHRKGLISDDGKEKQAFRTLNNDDDAVQRRYERLY